MGPDRARPTLSLSLRPPQASGLGDGHFRLLLTNAGPVDLAVQLEATDPESGLLVTFEPPLLVVPASQERYVPLRVHPRAPLPGEEPHVYPFTITAHPTDSSAPGVQVAGEWKQLAPSFELELRPARARGVAEGTFAVHATNHSLEELTLDLRAADIMQACSFAFQPGEIFVPAGQSGPAQLRVRACAPLPGSEPLVHTFTVTARPREAPQVLRQVQGEWEQTPPALELDLQPLQPRGTEGIFHLEVRNDDDVELTVQLSAADPAGACLYTLTPPLVVVPAGQVRPAQVRVQSRDTLRTVEARVHPFTVTARPAEAPGMERQASGEWIQLPAARPAVRTWGPLLALWWGWSAAFVVGGGLSLFLHSLYIQALLDLFVGSGLPVHLLLSHLLPSIEVSLLVGVFGGLVTALALRWAEPSLRMSHAWRILLAWVVCVLAVEGVVAGGVQHLPAGPWLAALVVGVYGVAVGVAGGAVTGLALRRALPRLRPLPLALGWAAAWGGGEVLVYLLAVTQGGRLQSLFAALPWPDYAAALAAWGVLGAIAGLGGGAVTLWEMGRARRWSGEG